MKVMLHDQQYDLRVAHFAGGSARQLAYLLHGPRRERIVGATGCSVVGPAGEDITIATTFCSVADVWDGARGAKKAIGRALQSWGLSKAERQQVWTQLLPKLGR